MGRGTGCKPVEGLFGVSKPLHRVSRGPLPIRFADRED